jgi:hypothetical protein
VKHGPNVWVVCDGGKYSIREEGQAIPLIAPTSQHAAIRIGRLIAKANSSELIVQGRHGRIRARDSHGSDSPYRDG